jgi:hypothetical protein
LSSASPSAGYPFSSSSPEEKPDYSINVIDWRNRQIKTHKTTIPHLPFVSAFYCFFFFFKVVLTFLFILSVCTNQIIKFIYKCFGVFWLDKPLHIYKCTVIIFILEFYLCRFLLGSVNQIYKNVQH